MSDMRTTTISADDIVALHVAALILRDKAEAQVDNALSERLEAYADRLVDLIEYSKPIDGQPPKEVRDA